MKHFIGSKGPAFDAASITATIRRAFASAGLDTNSGPMHSVTETIERALSSAGLTDARHSPEDAQVIDVTARVVGATEAQPVEPLPPPVNDPSTGATSARWSTQARFATHAFGNHAGSRAYKLYVPGRPSEGPRPMVVMLHGCTQSADDFAAGTRMNRLADEHGFVVVYPEQAAHANVSRCWNWFKAQDQVRDAGEPALIAGIVRDVAARHDIDLRRVFVAGLSAGAGMAVIMGETYPELFSAVGAHSGLPYGSAHDLQSALAAMKGGPAGMVGSKKLPAGGAAHRRQAARAVPTIVFHGDRDHTVQASNAAEIILQAHQAHASSKGESALRTSTQRGTASGGRSYSRTVHTDTAGQPLLESWTLHGAGHAWSGGDASGSYTDPAGPDASAEMIRFFLGLPRPGSA